MSAPILIVEDEQMQRQMLATLLRRKLGCEVDLAENGRKALESLAADKDHAIRLVIMDLDMPVMGGMETLEIIRQKYPDITLIMLTGSTNMEDAVRAMKLGATDFLSKPYEGERLLVTVKNALKIGMLTREVHRLTTEKEGNFTFKSLIGHEGDLAPIVLIGRKASASDIPVLLTGETGVGKEIFAKAIHGESGRAGKPFIAVNCGAIPAQLVESTLFGHEKGAFTGATDKTIGKFREAEGGTIFLDEVGELPLDTQVKLLRVLQQKEVEPVGAGKPVAVNVRIISATNRNLQQEIHNARFREDLYFRLNVLNIEIPPLRQRRKDIPLLAHHFIQRFCAQSTGPAFSLSKSALTALSSMPWPGNVRQLENVMNRAMVLADNPQLDETAFEQIVTSQEYRPAGLEVLKTPSAIIHLKNNQDAFKTMDQIESEAMQAALEAHQGNITRAAEALGIAKSTFYRKMDNMRSSQE